MSETNRDGMRQCRRGDDCIHPQGPLLPATPEFFHRRGVFLSGICKECRNAHNRQTYVRERRAERRREISREKSATGKQRLVTTEERVKRLAKIVENTPIKPNGLFKNYWEYED